MFERHSRHCEIAVSQNGVVPEQLELLVQPGRHTSTCGSHTGRAALQSPLPTHCTQVPGATRQRGALVVQSLSLAHCTHWRVVASQTFTGPPQSLDVRHPMHAPVDVSQIDARPGQSSLVVQLGWQVASPGQHAGAEAGQSLFWAHSPQVPVAAMQRGVGAAQSASKRQSTQPS
jgi:hypothetical protein